MNPGYRYKTRDAGVHCRAGYTSCMRASVRVHESAHQRMRCLRHPDTHIYIYTFVHVHICAHIYTRVKMCIPGPMHTYKYACVCVWLPVCAEKDEEETTTSAASSTTSPCLEPSSAQSVTATEHIDTYTPVRMYIGRYIQRVRV